jgi:hypothetical protein
MSDDLALFPIVVPGGPDDARPVSGDDVLEFEIVLQLQRVRVFMDKPPPAPYLIFVDGDGWRFDCGNCVGWSMFVPKRCRCGLCLPGYEPIRAGQAAAVRREVRNRQARDRRFWKRLKSQRPGLKDESG